MNSTPLYRARDGKILGVCQGFARYRNFPVTPLRILYILFTVFTGFWLGVGLYILAAVLMDPEPVIPPQTKGEADFYDRFNGSRAMALHDLKAKMDRVEERIRRMEDKVVRPEKTWEERLYTEKRQA